jgi:putative SOS response-associated peptidase YedK
VAKRFGVDEVDVAEAPPDYNVAPRTHVMAIRRLAEHRVLSRLRWGLVPSWADDPSIGDRMINARAESVATKPSFRRAYAKRRCIIPADGFYEWKVVGPPSTPKGRPRKQPMFVHRRDGEPLAMAGLWEAWKVPEGMEGIGDGDGWLRSCVIVTTRANGLLAPIHDRMPVVLPESSWGRWLDPDEGDPASLEGLLVPAPDEWLEAWPVSTDVNRPTNHGPELVAPVASDPGGDRARSDES